MKIKYSDKLQEWSEGYDLARQATHRLEDDVLGPSAGLVSGSWDRMVDEHGRPLLTLHLEDHTGSVNGRFALDELRSTNQTTFRLHRLWGDLLQVRNEHQLGVLMGTAGVTQ